jgi:transcription regulator MmyB-like protein
MPPSTASTAPCTTSPAWWTSRATAPATSSGTPARPAGVRELRAADPDVARRWDDHGVTDRTSVPERIAHPVAGPVQVGIEAVATPHDPEQRLVVCTVQPDPATARVLPLLAGWGAGLDARAATPD